MSRYRGFFSCAFKHHSPLLRVEIAESHRESKEHDSEGWRWSKRWEVKELQNSETNQTISNSPSELRLKALRDFRTLFKHTVRILSYLDPSLGGDSESDLSDFELIKCEGELLLSPVRRFEPGAESLLPLQIRCKGGNRAARSRLGLITSDLQENNTITSTSKFKFY